MFQEPGGYASDDYLWLDVSRDDRSRGNHCTAPDSDSANNCNVCADPHVVINFNEPGGVALIANRLTQRPKYMIAGTHDDVRTNQNIVPQTNPPTVTRVQIHVGVE